MHITTTILNVVIITLFSNLLESLPVLADLSWEDIVFPNLLPLLSPSDLFRLSAVDRQHHEMIQVFFVRNKRLDLSNSKKATKETFRILTQGAENLRYLQSCN